MAMTLLSSPPTPTYFPTLSTHASSSSSSSNTNLTFAHKPYLLTLLPRPNKTHFSTRATTDNGAGIVTSTTAVTEEKPLDSSSTDSVPKLEGENGPVVGPKEPAPPAATAVEGEGEKVVKKFQDPRWVNGTWDLTQFEKDGKTDWDAVIDAEARRRKWLENNPESSSNDDPVVFDTSIVPWWAWIKKFHLPEAELLNGRAAMIGFFVAYLVDSLTGLGVVDQMSNLFCKTLLFVAVVGVLLIRKNEDIETLKKLLEETTFYDRQWQATWQVDTKNSSKNE
ncbi:hypothetical protein Ancab_032905 [Ancistrocladus abbreviatus]